MKKLVFTVALSLLAACAPAPAELVTVNYCDHPAAGCTPHEDLEPEVQAQLSEYFWCCPWEGDDGCYIVSSPAFCNPEAEYAIYCEHGRTVEQSSGTGTTDCFG